MLDTKGVKIRTGRVEGGVAHLVTGEPFTLYTDGRMGDARGVTVSYTELPDEVEPGSKILIDDGVIELQVETVERDVNVIRCRITRGGNLTDRKGVNLPGTFLGMPAMTAENRADLVFAVDERLRLRRRVVRARPRGRARDPPGAHRTRRAHPDHREDRGRGRRAEPRGDRRGGRRHDGGARRPRRGDPAPGGSAHPEEDHPHDRDERKARDHGHPDARLDADARRCRRARRSATWPTRSSTARPR